MSRKLIFFSGLLAILFFSVAANAAGFTVTKATDTNDGVCDSDCSLREAVAAAGGLPGNGNVVIFSPALFGVPIVLSLGEITLNAVVISGAGADQIIISGNNAGRIFYLPPGMASTISGVTLTGGNGLGTGPATGSQAGGGAIRADGPLAIKDVSFTGNSTQSVSVEGSAIFYGTINNTIKNSAFIDNSGTALYSNATGLTVTNSTFAGGTAVMHFIGSTVNLRSCTVMSAVNIGGLASVGAVNSIISSVARLSMLGGFSSQGHNIVGGSTGNQVTFDPTDKVGVDPLLLSPDLNGGHTKTFALQPGSPAIDAGINAPVISAGFAIDQRRYARIVDGDGDANTLVDIGAYEFGSTPVTPIVFAGTVRDMSGAPIARATVFVTDSEGNIRSATTSPCGFFSIPDVYLGTLTVNTSAKTHRFNETVFYAAQNITNANLVGQ
jgi:CSLREA domain-containing protein